MKRITILGSTGSIGKSTLAILTHHRDKFEVVALTAKSQLDLLFQQCLQFNPMYAVMPTQEQAKQLQQKIQESKLKTEVLFGKEALANVAKLPEVDYVMAGIVGAAGLMPTMAAVQAGKTVLLANKESLVMAGSLFMETVKKSKATLLPVDSEHNAIFQCLPQNFETGSRPAHVKKIIITASGGPFRNLPLSEFNAVTPEQAVAHPNWSMGTKISVDSSTMMNKGFEVIEAFWLFNMDVSELEVIIHPESIIHSLVCYEDGSFLAQLGAPDMRTPIAYTLSWPERITTKVKALDLIEVAKLTFEPVDLSRFPCLELAYSVLKAGGTSATTLNAANEIAVAAFLNRQIRYTDIFEINAKVLEKATIKEASSIEVILEEDDRAREMAQQFVAVLE